MLIFKFSLQNIIYIVSVVRFFVNCCLVCSFVCLTFYFQFWRFNVLMYILALSGDSKLNLEPATHCVKKWCRVLYSNIRGLRSNFSDLKAHACNFGLMFLSETLVSDNKHTVEFLIPGFSEPSLLYGHNIPNAQGMAVYIISGLPKYHQSKFKRKCHESLCFIISSKYYKIYFFGCYWNPSSDDSM